MFNWFKNLVNPNKLLPKDVEKGLMTSMYYTAKIGDKFTVPDDCVCFLSYRDKIYKAYEAGSQQLDETDLSALLDKQYGKKEKEKKIKFDLFYVNLTRFAYSVTQLEKIPVDKQMCKIEIKTNFNVQVVDAKKFQKFALGYYALIRPQDAEKLIKEYVYEHIHYYYLKREFTSPIDTAAESDALIVSLNKKAAKIGVEFSGFELDFWIKTKGKQLEVKKKSIFDTREDVVKPIKAKTIDEPKNLEYNLQSNVEQSAKPVEVAADTPVELEKPNEVEKFDVCPNCQSKRIKNAAFCPKCGYKF